MKKLITIILLSLSVLACKEDKQQIDSNKLNLAKEDNAQNSTPEINSKTLTSYSFEWQLSYETEANNNKIGLQYLVMPKANYYGVARDLNKKESTLNPLTIFDFDKNKRFTLTDGKGGKFVRGIAMPDLKDNENQSITVERTDTKEILGYTCQGYKVTTHEGTSTMYITQDAGIDFTKGIWQYSEKSLKEQGIDASIINEIENGLMMEMNYLVTGNNAKATPPKMTIKKITKKSFTIDLNDYKKIGK